MAALGRNLKGALLALGAFAVFSSHDAAVKALNSPDVKDKLAAQGAEAIGSTPEEFRTYIKAEIEKWGEVVRVSGAKVD